MLTALRGFSDTGEGEMYQPALLQYALARKEMETASGANQDPDAAPDIDKKNNRKRKPEDEDGGVEGVDGNAKKTEGFTSVMKADAHPGFDAVAQRIADKEGVSLDRAKAILAAGSRGASAAAKKNNPRLKRV